MHARTTSCSVIARNGLAPGGAGTCGHYDPKSPPPGRTIMLEKLLRDGAPTPLLITPSSMGGAGTVCTQDVQVATLGGVTYKHLPFVVNGINSVDAGGCDVVRSEE